MAYTKDSPYFAPPSTPKYSLPVKDMEMLRRIARGGKVSDVSTETREQEQARRRENHAQIGQGRYGLIQPSPEDIAEAEKREALMAAGRESRRREIERNTAIAESMTAAAKKLWRRA